jgi:hypothetical protein
MEHVSWIALLGLGDKRDAGTAWGVQMGEERLRGVLEPRGEVSMACRSTKELTVPVTPRLRTSHRSSSSTSRSTSFDDLDAASVYVPLAERIRKNNEEGPRGKSVAPLPTGPYVKPALTAPKTPEFSSFRRKEAKARGFAASEAEQVEEMKRHQFKARPVRTWRGRAGLLLCLDEAEWVFARIRDDRARSSSERDGRECACGWACCG